MKLLKYILSVIIFTQVGTIFALDKDVQRDTEMITKSYPVSSDTYIEIENKYGDIEIITWEKDSVKITVELIFESDDINDIYKMRELYEIKFENNSNFILAKTEWSDDVGFFKKGISEISQNFGGGKKMEINYTIECPADLEMEITNKFGNIYMSDYHGSLKINLSYGDIRARSLTNLKKLEVGYGKVKIKEIKTGRLEFNSVKSADIELINDVILKSSSSEIEIEYAKKLNIDSRHDELVIKEVEELSGDLMLTDLEIDNLILKMGTNSKYGTIRIKEAEPGIEMINLNGNKTDFRIGFSSFFNGNVDVTVSKEADFLFTNQFNLEKQGVDPQGLWNGSGSLGENGKSKVMIFATNGYVEIEE